MAKAKKKSSAVKYKGKLCQWFILCLNDATGTKEHPIMGRVPICTRCREKVAAIDRATGVK